MVNDLILGTAGHIDHGKTSLIAALTGTNTDRLPEEKKRGITIELGYAYLELPPYRVGIVDVPGHEKFVRQMLAGATGIDLSLLVIAANDSVKQQTSEHMDILRILDLPAGVIAITKSDLVEPDWLELVQEEVRSFVAGSFLEDAPIVPTSAKTGDGLDELKSALTGAAEVASQSNRRMRIHAPFKMAIDRAFTIEGHGTVVTGSVSSGSAKLGDSLEIQPGGQSVRVRGVQNHDSSADEVHRGQRAAINITGVDLDDVRRGQELSAGGHLKSSQLLTVEMFQLQSATRPLRDRKRVRFHIGTAELLGTVKLLDKPELAPGEKGLAQIYLNEPTVAIWNQPFVIRRESPVFTIGGGRVLDPNANKIKHFDELDGRMLADLGDADDLKRANAAAYFHSESGWKPDELPRTAGVFEIEKTVEQLATQDKLIQLKLSPTRSFLIQRNRFEQFCDRVLDVLRKLHDEYPMRFKHAKTDLYSKFAYLESKEILNQGIKFLKSEKKINLSDDAIGLVGAGPKLSKGERQLLEQLTTEVRDAGLKPPTTKELIKSAKKNKDSVEELLRLAGENGELVGVANDLFFHRDVIDDVRSRLTDEINKTGGLTMSEIRQVLDTTRKFAIPLCEYLDSTGFTSRDGDKRVLGTSSEVAS